MKSEIDIIGTLLALENAERTVICVDSQPVPSVVTGWWVDEAIQIVALPALSAGTNEVVLTVPFGRKTNLEWCYLLGDFGVEVCGRHARIAAPVRTLTFGDWTRQALPFYAGNITYHCSIESAWHGKEMALRAPKSKSPLLSVALNGREVGKVAFAPYQLELGKLAEGQHALDITAYGNRANAFGCVHNTHDKNVWCCPDAWRTAGDAWSYEYQLKPMGLLAAPQVMTRC